MFVCTYSALFMMTDLFTLDIMVGYVIFIQDEPCLFPTVILKLLNFPGLTVHCIPPSEQQKIKKKFHSSDLPSNTTGIKSSQNHVVFKRGKSCSFKLSKQDAQQLFFPLTITLNDSWYIPVKELARTRINVLVPHFKQGSVIHPMKSCKQVYELCNAYGSKVAMIELSYKLKRIQTDVIDTLSGHKTKPICSKETPSKGEQPMDTKQATLPQKYTDGTSDNTLLDKLTVCPPPLLYRATSDADQGKLQSEIEPVTSQDKRQVVWPNGYIQTDPGWNVSNEDNFNDVLLPSCPQYVVPPIAQEEVNVSSDQNFWILRTLMKELSAMEQLLKSKGVNPPVQKCSDVCVQTENLNNSETKNIINVDKYTPTKVVANKPKKKFTRQCCTAKLDHSLAKRPGKVKARHTNAPSQNKTTSPRIKSMHQMVSPRNKTTPSVLYGSRTRKVKVRSPLKWKSPPQIQLDSAVSRVSQLTITKDSENDEEANEKFSANTSVEHKGDHSKLNLEIHLPAMTKIPSTTNLSSKQDDAISSIAVDTTATPLLTLHADSITPCVTPKASAIPLTSASQSVTPMPSAMPLTPASQSEHFTLASSNNIQSYTNLSLSKSTEDVLNQSHISNVMFSAKHLEAALADDKSTKSTSPATDHDKPSSVDAASPATSSSQSIEYKDDFESSDNSSISSKTS